MDAWERLFRDEREALDFLLSQEFREEIPIMTEEQAEALEKQIKEQFPHVWTCVLESADRRNSPKNWFVAVRRGGDEIGNGERPLIIRHEHEWREAQDALRILNP